MQCLLLLTAQLLAVQLLRQDVTYKLTSGVHGVAAGGAANRADATAHAAAAEQAQAQQQDQHRHLQPARGSRKCASAMPGSRCCSAM